MRYYTPREALKIVRFRQGVHHALSVIAATLTMVGLVLAIGCAEGESWGLSALSGIGTCVAAILCGIEDALECSYQEDENRIIAEYLEGAE